MLKDLFSWFLSSIIQVFNIMKSFVLDSSSGVTFFHFLIFIIFIGLVIRVINFIKQIQEVESEDRRHKK